MIGHKLPNKTKNVTVAEPKLFHQLNNPVISFYFLSIFNACTCPRFDVTDNLILQKKFASKLCPSPVSRLQTGSARWIESSDLAFSTSVKSEPFLSHPHQSARPAHHRGGPPTAAHHPGAAIRRAAAARADSPAATVPPGHHGVRRACSGGAPPQGLVSVLLRFRSPGSLAPPR
jgi:hypothetical protein